jgi:hypothetical protein
MALCPTCGKEFESLGTHFRYHDHRPEITDKQHEIITGLLMGDGSLGYRNRGNSNSFLSVKMRNEEFIDHLIELFDPLSRNKVIDPLNGTDYYKFETRSHPELNEYREWYQPDKVWPEIEVTPTVLKYLYVSDGTYDTDYSHDRIMIAAAKEGSESEKVERMFEQSGYPVSRTYHYEREGRSDDYQLWFDVPTTKKMFKDMGDAPPGFEYKWPIPE